MRRLRLTFCSSYICIKADEAYAGAGCASIQTREVMPASLLSPDQHLMQICVLCWSAVSTAALCLIATLWADGSSSHVNCHYSWKLNAAVQVSESLRATRQSIDHLQSEHECFVKLSWLQVLSVATVVFVMKHHIHEQIEVIWLCGFTCCMQYWCRAVARLL